MPWIKNEDGTTIYKVSLYTKEELPTWNEVYNEWYQNVYDENILDTYWKIPKQAYLNAIICNQFNKMVFEDGYQDGLINFINTHKLFLQMFDVYPVVSKVIDVRFVAEDIHDKSLAGTTNLLEYHKSFVSFAKEKYKCGDSLTPPPIYTPFGDGEENIFVVNNHPRIHIPSLEYENTIFNIIVSCSVNDEIYILSLNLSEIIKKIKPGNNGSSLTKTEEEVYSLHNAIVGHMIIPFKTYFENGVGWKDVNEDLIGGNESKNNCDTV